MKVKTIWSMFTGPTGAYITERADGQPMSPELKSYVEGLWAGWACLESKLVMNQTKAKR